MKKENITQMDRNFLKKTVSIGHYRLKFAYNAQMNYLYFDWYNSDGSAIRYHNKVIRDYDFGGFYFTSERENPEQICIADNIESWNLVEVMA